MIKCDAVELDKNHSCKFLRGDACAKRDYCTFKNDTSVVLLPEESEAGFVFSFGCSCGNKWDQISKIEPIKILKMCGKCGTEQTCTIKK
jgi:hypothetical protein